MTNTKWYNASGAGAASYKGYYTPKRYDNNHSNQTTARDLSIMAYNLIKHHPEILKYTSQQTVTVKKGTPYEETFENYNFSLPGADYGLKGVDGLKQAQVLVEITTTSPHANEEINESFQLSWALETGKMKVGKKSAMPSVTPSLRKCLKTIPTRKS